MSRPVPSSIIDYVRTLERHVDDKRAKKDDILRWLQASDCSVDRHQYSSGENIIATMGPPPYVCVGSHYDVVDNCPGANDNGSAVAVTLDLVRRFSQTKLNSVGVKAFFFDEEEVGLIGSQAYLNDFGTDNILGLYNMELVGSGDIAALWSVNESDTSVLLDALCSQAESAHLPTRRFTNILNGADHMCFTDVGVDSFTLTMVCEDDLLCAKRYYAAMRAGVPHPTLYSIMDEAPLFTHYHKPTDLSEHLSEKTLQRVSSLLYNSITAIDRSS